MEKKGRGATPVPPVRQVEEKGFFERKMPETAKKYAKKERLSTLLFRMSDCGELKRNEIELLKMNHWRYC